MPPVIGQPIAIGTLPHSLSTKFTEAHSVLMNMNQYHDLRSQRVALVTGGRKSWKISKRLDAHSLGLLRQFCYAAKGGAFYFYNPSETNPPYSNNPSGTAGRYLVRFNSDWSQTTGMSRSETSIELVEVSEFGAVDIGAPIEHVPTGPPLNPLIQVPINPSVAGGEELRYGFQAQVGYGPITYGGYLWAFTVGSIADYDPVSNGFGGGVYKSADGITWTKEGASSWFQMLPYAAYWDGSSDTITILTCDPWNAPNFIPNIRGQLVDFHMATGLYDEPSPVVDIVSSNPGAVQFLWTDGWVTPGNIRVFRLSNGTYRIIYKVLNDNSQRTTVTDMGIYYLDYAEGAWSSPVVVAGGSGNWYNPAYFVQDGDTVHVFYGIFEYANGGALPSGGFPTIQRTGFEYIRVAGDGSLTSPQQIDAMSGTGSYSHPAWVIETPIISGSNIILPATQMEDPDGSDIGHVGVLIGTPKENPVFTWVPLGGIPDYASYPQNMKLIRLGSTVYFAWISFDATFTNIWQIFLTTSSDDGLTWTPYKVLLNTKSNSPARLGTETNEFGDPVTDFDLSYLYSISLGTHLDGSLGLLYTTWATYWTNAPALLP